MYRSVLFRLSVGSLLTLVAPPSVHGASPDQSTIESLHKDRIERLKEAVSKYDQFSYAIHTLIVPQGAVANYNFPIPVARIRYEAVPFFDFNVSQPRQEAAPVVQQLAHQFIADKSLARIAVVGHTDSVGSDNYNYDLSLRRAWSVANLLRAQGVPADKIVVIGLGASYPIATNMTDQGRALNRRVEFFLSSIREAIGPSIQGTEVDPRFRNNQKPECQNGNSSGNPADKPDDCKAKITRFPIQSLGSDGQLKPTGEAISVNDHPSFHVQEIEERVHVPMDEMIRPHVPN